MRLHQHRLAVELMQVDDGWLLQLEEDDEPLSQGPQMGKESPGQGY